jgi:hypothetical protein
MVLDLDCGELEAEKRRGTMSNSENPADKEDKKNPSPLTH